jgi:hypothetical protein
MGCADRIIGIVNPERLRFKNPWFHGDMWHVPKDAMITWDEVHKGASGPKTLTTRFLALTKAQHIPVLAMSATIADSPLKMRGLGFLLGQHKFNQADFYAWCRKHGCKNSPWHSGLEFPKGPKGAKAMQQIHAAIADRLVRIRIADVPEFPENQILANLYDLEDKYRDEINAIYEEMDETIKKGGTNPLTEQLRARQKTELLKVPLLRDLAVEAIEEGKSVVVFVNFRESLFALQSEIASSIEGTCGVIYGGQKDAERNGHIDAFQANLIPCIVAMSQAGGVGISLQDLKQERQRVSFITPSYNAVEMVQCLGRIHRAGGTKTVQTFCLVAETLEEKIHGAIQRKLNNIAALNDGDLTGV